MVEISFTIEKNEIGMVLQVIYDYSAATPVAYALLFARSSMIVLFGRGNIIEGSVDSDDGEVTVEPSL